MPVAQHCHQIRLSYWNPDNESWSLVSSGGRIQEKHDGVLKARHRDGDLLFMLVRQSPRGVSVDEEVRELKLKRFNVVSWWFECWPKQKSIEQAERCWKFM